MVNPRINLNTSIFWGWLITTDSCQFWGWFYHGPWPANALNTNVTPLPGPEVLLSDSRGSGKRSIGKAWRSWLPQAATMLEHDRACGGATMELNMIPDFSWKVVLTHLQPINLLNTDPSTRTYKGSSPIPCCPKWIEPPLNQGFLTESHGYLML